MKPKSFSGGKPALDPLQFFTGNTSSTGVRENRAGDPVERVTTQTHAKFVGETLRMEQDLQFGSGKTSHRSWQLRRLDEHHFEGTANDVPGVIHGEAYGDVFHWEFPLELSPGNPLTRIRMSQWMYLQPDGRTLVNHTTISKAGLVVGQVTEQFHHL